MTNEIVLTLKLDREVTNEAAELLTTKIREELLTGAAATTPEDPAWGIGRARVESVIRSLTVQKGRSDEWRNEIETPYVSPGDRWVVGLVVGYSGMEVPDAIEAADSALELTRDGSHDGTVWSVCDRATGETKLIEQHEFDNRQRA